MTTVPGADGVADTDEFVNFFLVDGVRFRTATTDQFGALVADFTVTHQIPLQGRSREVTGLIQQGVELAVFESDFFLVQSITGLFVDQRVQIFEDMLYYRT